MALPIAVPIIGVGVLLLLISGGFVGPMIAAGVVIAAPVLTVLAGFTAGIITHFRHQKANEKAFAEASTPKQLVPLFWKLAPEAQARFFVDLGPEFRKNLCALSGKKYGAGSSRDTRMQEMADIVGILQGSIAVPEEDRKQAVQIFLESSYFSWDWKANDFGVALQNLVRERGMIKDIEPPPYTP